MNAVVPEQDFQYHQATADSLKVSLMEEPLHSDDSGIPVLQLITALREYHQLRDFSHQERFGTRDPQSTQALNDLEEAHRAMRVLTSSAGGDVRIEASLNLKVTPAVS